jgi:threonine synthase
MKFYSTRNRNELVSFRKAVEQGLAPDGGLYVPVEFPHFSIDDFEDLSFQSVAVRMIEPFLREDFSNDEIQSIATRAFHFPTPLTPLTQQTSLLELFHGPTAAFKDVAAQFLGEVMARFNNDNETKTILVATSGDTGGAVAAAFNGRAGFRVIILFPLNGVSELQKQQLTCWDKNIISLAVRGTFDDCQRMVKNILANQNWVSHYLLTSANSINIARLLPQTIYYATSSLLWWRDRQQKASYVIPTGNMGNCVAAFWAQKMGLPIDKIVLATNANHVIADYYATGTYQPHSSLTTLANAMDVGSPSNFERLVALWPELSELRKVSAAVTVSDHQIRETILTINKTYGIAVCPHTATALAVRAALPGNWIVVATAHSAKFTEVVEPIVKKLLPVPECLREIRHRRSQYKVIDPIEAQVMAELGDPLA